MSKTKYENPPRIQCESLRRHVALQSDIQGGRHSVFGVTCKIDVAVADVVHIPHIVRMFIVWRTQPPPTVAVIVRLGTHPGSRRSGIVGGFYTSRVRDAMGIGYRKTMVSHRCLLLAQQEYPVAGVGAGILIDSTIPQGPVTIGKSAARRIVNLGNLDQALL